MDPVILASARKHGVADEVAWPARRGPTPALHRADRVPGRPRNWSPGCTTAPPDDWP